MTDMVIPPEAVDAAAMALNEAVCICLTGRNQYGPWYTPQPTCPRCGDNFAKSRVALEAALPHLRPAACTCPTDADVTPDMRSETGQHLSGCPFTAEGLGAWMDEWIERINETKALVETATRLGRELGRREAAEEAAKAIEDRSLDGTWNMGGQVCLRIAARIAREIATKEPK